MKEFRSIFKQDFADYIETNQGTISNDTLRNTRSVLLTFDSLLAKESDNEQKKAGNKRKHWRNLGSDCKPMDQETPSGQCTQDRQ